jgi:hypothetical protein
MWVGAMFLIPASSPVLGDLGIRKEGSQGSQSRQKYGAATHISIRSPETPNPVATTNIPKHYLRYYY